MTTVGYGDFAPDSTTAKALAMLFLPLAVTALEPGTVPIRLAVLHQRRHLVRLLLPVGTEVRGGFVRRVHVGAASKFGTISTRGCVAHLEACVVHLTVAFRANRLAVDAPALIAEVLAFAGKRIPMLLTT